MDSGTNTTSIASRKSQRNVLRGKDGSVTPQAAPSTYLPVQVESSESGELPCTRKRKRRRKADAPIDQIVVGSVEARGNEPSTTDVDTYSDDKTVYVEGLPFSATEEDIISFFSPAGKVASIRLPRWHDSGRLRGYGHVVFQDRASAQKAMGLDGTMDSDYC
jgi:RNA recognition motif-containing protein